MSEIKRNQSFTDVPGSSAATWQTRTVQTPPAPLPLLISKKWLCIHFGLIGPAGKANTEALYRKVLTPDVLQAVGLSEAVVRCRTVRTFDRTTSIRIIAALGLQ